MVTRRKFLILAAAFSEGASISKTLSGYKSRDAIKSIDYVADDGFCVVSDNGLKWFVKDGPDMKVYQLSIAYDLSTASFIGTKKLEA